MVKKRVFLLFVFSVTLMISCSDLPTTKPLRVGFNTWPGYEFIYLAKVKGYFEEEDVQVKLVELNSLSDVRRAFERGQIDIMASTMVEVLVAAENSNRSLKIIAVADSSNGGDMLLAAKPISQVSQLKGKKLGLEGATVDVLAAGAALRSAGLTFEDVQVVPKSQDDLVADLKAGKIDAIETYPPYAIDLLATGKFNKIFDSSKIPGEIIDTISIDKNVLNSQRAQIRSFLKAYFRAFDYFKMEPQKSSAIMGKREGISGDEFLEAINGMTVFGLDDQLPFLLANEKGGKVLQQSAEFLTDTGWLREPVDVSQFFDPNPKDILP